MKIITLAISNIKHNLRNYAMYFFAMCFCVFTSFSFANLTLSETVYNHVLHSQKYQNIFVGFGITIMVFVVFFLISSNNSFIRFRKKEISTYALFGMENNRIGLLLFTETMIIGIAALIIGIAIGVFFSKLLSMILLKMLVADFAKVTFNIELKALLITSAIYIVIFCIMGLSGLRTINKFQLIDLFKGEKVAEKRTKGSFIMLIISLGLIILGYKLAIADNGFDVMKFMLLVIVVVVVGTYLFYIGGVQKLLYLLKKNKRYFYKKSRLISVSMLSHKTRTMASTMGTIAVLIAASTTAMAFGYTLYQSAESNAKEVSHFDVWYYADNEKLEQKIYDTLSEHDNKAVDIVKFQRYVSTPEDDNILEGYSNYFTDIAEYSMTYSESTFNSLVAVSQDSNTPISVEKGELMVLYPNYLQDFNFVTGTVKYGDNIFNITFNDVYNPYNYGTYLTIVLNDEDFDELLEESYIKDNIDGEVLYPFVGINYENSLNEKHLAKDLTTLIANSANVGKYRIMYNNYIESMEIFGLICFIGYFICGVFILMSVSLLYFKQVAIGTEESSQYIMLRKIGMDSEEEKSVIRKRIAPVFFIPLFMGLIHSIFAMKGADTMIFSNIIRTQGSTYLEVLKISFVMYLIYTLAYYVFYLITKYQYSRVVSHRQ